VKKHIELLGILYIVYNAFSILGAILVFTVLSGIGIFSGIIVSMEEPFAGKSVIAILTALGIIISGLLLLTSIPGIIGGIGLLKYKNWARILTLILGAINLMNVPFGTLLGAYTFYVLLQHETIALLDGDTIDKQEVNA